MKKFDLYNHPLVKRQQRKQRHGSAYMDNTQARYKALLEELKSEREASKAESTALMSAD